jgi:xanthine dehydrogenase large subunit
MRVTGKRHAYLSEWEVGFGDDGRILALRVAYYSNGGVSTDLSLAVMERTLLHTDNCYFLPHVELTGQVCFTNLPSNTAFRGFGGPQGMTVIENILESIAEHTGLDAYDVRTRNLYGVGERNVTPYGQVFDRNHLPEIFATLAARSQYRKRREEVTRFNGASRTQVRGLAMTGVKFGISFTTSFLNQGNALVNIYTDGTVQVSTGATEMGQGGRVRDRCEPRCANADEHREEHQHVADGRLSRHRSKWRSRRRSVPHHQTAASPLRRQPAGRCQNGTQCVGVARTISRRSGTR